MRSGMKCLLALAMFLVLPAACLTEAPPEAGDLQTSSVEASLEQPLRCPGGLVDCCGDGTCTLPQVCKHIQCNSEAPPITTQSCTAEFFCESTGAQISCGGSTCNQIWSIDNPYYCWVCPAGSFCNPLGVGCGPYGGLSNKVCGAVHCDGYVEYCPPLPGALECF